MQQQRNSQRYIEFLTARKKTPKQTKISYDEEDNVVWRSLLVVAQAQKIINHKQAIDSLKLSLSQVEAINRIQENVNIKQIYKRTIVCILSHLISRQILADKYKQARQSLKQLKEKSNEIIYIRQSMMIFFGIDSMVALRNYDVFNNVEFKYDNQTQKAFLVLLGQVKYYLGKKIESKIALEKFKMLRGQSCKKNNLLDLISSRILKQVEPQQYTQYYHSVRQQNIKYAQNIDDYLQIRKQLVLFFYQAENKKSQYQILKQINISDISYVKIYLNFLMQRNPHLLVKDQYKELVSQINSENNSYFIRQVQKTQFFKDSIEFCQQKFHEFGNVTKKIILLLCFHKIKAHIKCYSVINTRSHKFDIPRWQQLVQAKKNKKKFDKTKYKELYNKIKHPQAIPQDQQKIQSIIKQLMKGQYVQKVNYNTKGISNKYLVLSQKQIRWSDDKNQIHQDYSKLKIKNILGIVYGKVSENLTRKSYNSIQPWLCFSLITADRSYDFIVKNTTEIFFWLQGISYYLQKIHKDCIKYPFYSKNRVLWKVAFLKIKFRYPPSKQKEFKSAAAGSYFNYRKICLEEQKI